MGKLTDILKESTGMTDQVANRIETTSVDKFRKQTKKVSELPDANDDDHTSITDTDTGFELSDAEYQEVRDQIAEFDTTGKDRREITVGMFGGIKDPRTGKRFPIPNLEYSDPDYLYKYSKFMKMLIFRPDEFKKILDWE